MNNLYLQNPLFKKILKEELDVVRRVINENYSADKIWAAMPEQDRESALYSAKVSDPSAMLNNIWDEIPADVQDLIDLSDYELANDDRVTGRVNLRALAALSKEDEKVKNLVNKFLQAVGRESIQLLTKKQSIKLLDAAHNVMSRQVLPADPDNYGNINPRDFGSLGS
jgi:hypothetical protein